ncbi:MAG TPA: TIR domain-containing protein [Caulobacteraceae bacterium]|nr:TIR domain-containing protein [Caulobacteraceae bacterium]
MSDPGQKYWAFLSYSHADRKWATWLHRALEGYVVPRRLVGHPTQAGPAPRRFRPIFRDRDELPAAADLAEPLRAALSASAYIIVVCSPDAARSKWVEQELREFRNSHGDERVLSVIVGGRPFASNDPDDADAECFPESLRPALEEGGLVGDRRRHPAAADLRPGKDGRRGALLKLVSGMLHVGLDEVVQRDAHRRHQQQLALTFASLAAAGAMAALSLVAVLERNEAEAQRAQAEGLVEFMIGDLRKTLEPAGRLDALDAIGARALSYYAAQSSRGLDAESLGRRARVLQILGKVREQRGDLPAALAFFEESAKSTAELLKRSPNDPQRIFDHAQSVFYIGEVAFERGDNAGARQDFEDYQRLANRLVQLEPRKADWWAEVDAADANLGAVLLKEGHPDEAAASFSEALTISRNLAAGAPDDRDRQADLSSVYAWLADAETARGRLDAAVADRESASAIYQRLIQRMPGDTASAVALAANRTSIARIQMAQGALPAAISGLQAAATEMDRLIAGAPDNESYKANAAPTYLLLGQALLQSGQLDAASEMAARTQRMSEAPAARQLAGQGVTLGRARLLAIKIAASRPGTAADQAAALQPAFAEATRLVGLADANPHAAALAGVAAEAALLAGDAALQQGGVVAARNWWTAAQARLSRIVGLNPPTTDRTSTLLRQLAFRLRFSQPPMGALPAGSSVTVPPRRAALPAIFDYKW